MSGIEEYLSKFQFKKLSPEERKRIWHQIEGRLEGRERFSFWKSLDRLWNIRYGLSFAGAIIFALFFNGIFSTCCDRYLNHSVSPEYSERWNYDRIQVFLEKNPDCPMTKWLSYFTTEQRSSDTKDYRQYRKEIQVLLS